MEERLLHVFLAVDIISFSLGFVIIAISLLSYARSGLVVFRQLALLFLASVILFLCRTIKVYEYATEELVFGGHLSILAAALTAPGNGLLVWTICVTTSEIASWPVLRMRLAACIALAVGAAALGGLRELWASLPFLRVLDNVGFAAILGLVSFVILRSTARVGNEKLLSLVRRLAIGSAIAAPAIVVQVILQAILQAAPPLRNFPFVQVAFYLALGCMVLLHLVRIRFEPESLAVWRLPEEIVDRYGISPREREIITMLVQGYPNRVIGEKLFISTTTVKNHIYHIYQKTGVTNKIQLINLINSPK